MAIPDCSGQLCGGCDVVHYLQRQSQTFQRDLAALRSAGDADEYIWRRKSNRHCFGLCPFAHTRLESFYALKEAVRDAEQRI